MLIGDVARFYGDGIVWARALPVPELLEWGQVMTALRERDHGR